MDKFKLYRQYDQMDCGPTCFQIAKHQRQEVISDIHYLFSLKC